MYLIQLLLPLRDNEQQAFPAEQFSMVRAELTHKFGGVTAYVRAPAKGLWETNEGINSDDVVLFEIVAERLDKEWWQKYRINLQQIFKQEEVLIWATTVAKL